MSTLVIVVRALSLVAFAWPMLLLGMRRAGEPAAPAPRMGSARTPLVANLAAFGLFLLALVAFAGNSTSSMALPLALSGLLLVLAGVSLVLRSRNELGRAWSLLPAADENAGLITTGPYRRLRHPIYLGLTLLAMGQALAFGSWPAGLVVLCAIVPTLAWRARAEEALLQRIFGERYDTYRQRTKMIIPHLL